MRRWVVCSSQQVAALEGDMPCITTPGPGGSDDEVADALLRRSDRADWARDILTSTDQTAAPTTGAS